VEKITPENIPNIDMENRIDRTGDESLYQPKIHSERIRDLYQIKEITGIPMTVLVDIAIREFLENYQQQVSESQHIYEGERNTHRTI
jgi:hypothetical protein